jgi:tetrameric-type glycyl-tRNA synthetase alpha subunit
LSSNKPNSLTFQQLILKLQAFYAERGAVIQQPYDVEVGAGTMAPETFLRVLGPNPYKVAYVQPSRRPADGRYGENPNRLFKHLQLQVILKPPPENVQELYLESLGAIGIDLRQHDIKFEEDNWESPTLGAWGIGWQVMLDGLEVTQFTYFQQCGGVDLDPISAELTYGLERLCAFLQDVDSIYDIVWARDPVTGREVKYGEVRLADEQQFSVYNFEMADVEKTWKHFELYESECLALLNIQFQYRGDISGVDWSWPDIGVTASSGRLVRIDKGMTRASGLQPNRMYDFWPVLDTSSRKVTFVTDPPKPTRDQLLLSKRPLGAGTMPGTSGILLVPNPGPSTLLGAYDLCLKCSHYFNILDARGAISVTERVGVIARVRALAVGIAKAWMDQQ